MVEYKLLIVTMSSFEERRQMVDAVLQKRFVQRQSSTDSLFTDTNSPAIASDTESVSFESRIVTRTPSATPTRHQQLLSALQRVETYAFAVKDQFTSENYSQVACEHVVEAFEQSFVQRLPAFLKEIESSTQSTTTKSVTLHVPLQSLAGRNKLLRWVAENCNIIQTAIASVVDDGFRGHHIESIVCVPQYSLNGYGSVCTSATIDICFTL